MLLRWTAFGMLALMVIVTSGCGSSTSLGPPNPTPAITALFPSSITAGSQSFTLFISGTDSFPVRQALRRPIGTGHREPPR